MSAATWSDTKLRRAGWLTWWFHASVLVLGAVLVRSGARRVFSAAVVGAGFLVSGVLAAVLFDRSPEQQLLLAESMTRDRLAALTQIMVAGFGLAAVLVSWGDRRRDHVGEYYALLAAAGGGMAFFVSAGNLMTLFLGLEWFSIALYILVALDTHRKESLEAGPGTALTLVRTTARPRGTRSWPGWGSSGSSKPTSTTCCLWTTAVSSASTPISRAARRW